jgi:DNA-binding IclR family transcriptional regulator
LKLDGFTKRTITNEDRLIEECETVVERGYGTDWGEADEGIHCVAAPIFDPLGQLVSVVWVSAVAGRMPRVRFGAVSKLVMQAAREIEGRLAR